MKKFQICWSNSLFVYIFLANIFSSYSVIKISPKNVNIESIEKLFLEYQTLQEEEKNIQNGESDTQDLENKRCELVCPVGSKKIF